jgi:hypothetical protein
MMKNTEWGAASYLAQSIYGKNAEIWMNNSSTYITGCVGNSVTPSTYAGCQNAYNTANGQQASTTGNTYGVYDMSGGAWEYVSAYADNSHTNLTTYGNSAYAADNKYKNVYSVASTDSESNNYAVAISSKGDAIYETSSAGSGTTSWYSDYSYMTRTDSPWFSRGGDCNNGFYAGSFFFYNRIGNAGGYIGFRPVLVVNSGL